MIANIFSLLNLILGFLGIVVLATTPPSVNVYTAIFYIVAIASIFDLMDGAIARRSKRKSSIGKELDSLADSISFGILPGLYTYIVITTSFTLNPSWLTKIIAFATASIYIISIVLRLARFNVSNKNFSYYRGLPSPVAALTLIFVTNWSYLPGSLLTSTITFQLKPYFQTISIIIVPIIIAILAVSKIRFPKPERFVPGLSRVAFITIVLLLSIIAFKYFLTLLMITYFISPIFIRKIKTSNEEVATNKIA